MRVSYKGASHTQHVLKTQHLTHLRIKRRAKYIGSGIIPVASNDHTYL